MPTVSQSLVRTVPQHPGTVPPYRGPSVQTWDCGWGNFTFKPWNCLCLKTHFSRCSTAWSYQHSLPASVFWVLRGEVCATKVKIFHARFLCFCFESGSQVRSLACYKRTVSSLALFDPSLCFSLDSLQAFFLSLLPHSFMSSRLASSLSLLSLSHPLSFLSPLFLCYYSRLIPFLIPQNKLHFIVDPTYGWYLIL